MIIYYKSIFKNLPLQKVGANFFLILAGGLVVLISSCNKTSVIGLNVQPNNVKLNVNFIDTTTLITKTVLTGPIETDQLVTQSITADALIGTYWDPVFGKTSASFYTQLRLNTYNPSFGTNPRVDSIILSLVYDSAYYGQTPFVPQNITVSKITGNFANATPYYSNDSLSVETDLANNLSFTPKPLDSVKVNGTVSPPQLRIPLAHSFGQDILNHPANLTDSTTFQNNWQGLYISTQNTTGLNVGQGNILRFQMGNAATNLTIYYHNDTALSLSFGFTFNSVSHFSNFKHNYSGIDPTLASQLGNTPPLQNDKVFLQPMAGTRVKIQIPYLMNWLSQGKIGINQAQLVITANTSSSYPLTTFFPAPALVVYGINDDGSIYTVADANEGANYFGGTYNSSTYQYTFNIARYIQQVLDGTLHNNGLYLTAVQEFINPARVVIGGGSSNNPYQMKLNITRTKLP